MPNNKHVVLFDSQKSRDTADTKNKIWTRSEVIFKDIDTGEVLLTTHNKVVIAGSQFVAQKVFNMDEKVALPTYNTNLGLDNTATHETTVTTHKCCLFCCGRLGCGTESSQVNAVKYTGRIKPDSTDIVPFRYQLTQNDLSDELRAKYFGRKTDESAGRIAYYFKAFESDPTMYMRYTDGTAIDENLYDATPTDNAETFVEMSLQITKDDFRDYFRATTGINDARINSISLATAWYTEAGGYKWYQDITPFTQLNIPNEPLIDLTKGIDITYHIYF